MTFSEIIQVSAGRARVAPLFSGMATAVLAAGALAAFLWPPAIAVALRIEPFVPVILGTIAILIALAGPLRRLTPYRVQERRAFEARRLHMDVPMCAATVVIFLLPVVAVWHSRYPSAETASSALMTRLPWNDATGYWEGALGILEHGKFDAWNFRRPLNAVLYSIRLGVTGLDFEASLLLQAVLLGCGVFLPFRAIRTSYGAAAGVAFVAGLYPYARNYVGLTLSEALGITLGCVALAGLIAGGTERDSRVTLCGLFLLGLALFARTGTMFVLPALVVWFSFAGRRSSKLVLQRFLWAFVAAIVLPILLNKSLTVFYGEGPGMMNDNFAPTILGLTMGTNWIQAQNHYLKDLQALAWDQQSVFLYQRAWEHFQNNPWVLLQSLARGFLQFFYTFPSAYRRIPFPPALEPFSGFLGLVAVAFIPTLCAIQLVRRGSWRIIGMWTAFTAGFLASIPFIWGDGGRRALAATFPMIPGLLAMTFATRKQPVATTVQDNKTTGAIVFWIAVAVVVVALAMPGVLHILYATPAPPATTLQADEIMVDGYAAVGAEVVERANRNRRGLTQVDVQELAYTVRATLGPQDLPSFLEYPRPYYFFLAYDIHLRYPIFVFAPASEIPPRNRVVKLKVRKTHRVPYIGYLAE